VNLNRLHDLSVRYAYAVLAVFLSLNLCACSKNKAESGRSDTNPYPSPSSKTKPESHATVKSEPTPKYVFKKPDHVKGLYLTAWTAGSSALREKVLGIADRTEINAVVIDVRDMGQMYFKTGIPLADESKATMVAVPRPKALFDSLEKHHVWPIARIACFRDDYVTKKHPEQAVQLKGGKVWHDRAKHGWLDPYNKKNWDYLAATVDYALDMGFPEIQLDYVRFPSEGKSATQVFPAKSEYAKKGDRNEDVIAAFAKFISDRVHARKAVISADIFGIISSTKGDEGIGQQLEKVAEPFDVLSPMVYPSHFAKGEYGIKDPNRSPYEIIKKSLADYKKRIPKVEIRPWLQDFSLMGVHYGDSEVRAQIKAVHDLGYQGYLLWSPKNRYTESALGKK